MADSTKASKGQGKRATNDENGTLSGLLAGASSTSSSAYDPATLLCKCRDLQYLIFEWVILAFCKK